MYKDAYGTAMFWEWALEHHNVWQGFFLDAKKISSPIFLNTTMIQYQGIVYDNDWVCYPNIYAALGFIQYVFLPSVFYAINHPENQQIYIPVCSTETYIEEYLNHENAQCRQMAETLRSLALFWQLEASALVIKLLQFCNRFMNDWSTGDTVMNIRLFQDAYDVNRFVQEALWDDGIFYEDIGVRRDEFEHFCEQFYQETSCREIFIRFLNHRVGCVV